MDVTLVATAAVALLRPFLGGLTSAATSALESAGTAVGEEAAGFARDIWGKLRDRLSPSAREAAKEAGDAPDNDRAVGALIWEIEQLLKADPALAAALQSVVERADAAGALQIDVTASGDRSIAVGGDVTRSSLSTGDRNP